MRSATLRPRHGGEVVLDHAELAADQREQIGRLRPRVVPDREVPAARQVAVLDQIAVRQQHRRFGFVRLDAGGVDRHHVGTIGEIGDAAEAFGLALRAVGAGGAVKPGQLRVGGRIDQRLDLQRERPVRRLRDGQAVRRRGVAVGGQRLAVELERDQRQPIAVELERRGRAGGGIGLELDRGAHRALRRIELDVEMHGLDQPVGRAIVGKADGAGFFGSHRSWAHWGGQRSSPDRWAKSRC